MTFFTLKKKTSQREKATQTREFLKDRARAGCAGKMLRKGQKREINDLKFQKKRKHKESRLILKKERQEKARSPSIWGMAIKKPGRRG